jgi:NAD(P)-dependent dehydrogenase (short-subunit alcohol dehydrogenase family)
LHQKDADAAAANLVDEFGDRYCSEFSAGQSLSYARIESSAEIERGSLQTAGFQCDVSNESSVKDTFESIKRKWGKVDCTVASAGEFASLPPISNVDNQSLKVL